MNGKKLFQINLLLPSHLARRLLRAWARFPEDLRETTFVKCTARKARSCSNASCAPCWPNIEPAWCVTWSSSTPNRPNIRASIATNPSPTDSTWLTMWPPRLACEKSCLILENLPGSLLTPMTSLSRPVLGTFSRKVIKEYIVKTTDDAGEEMFECSICNTQSRHKRSIVRHMLIKHTTPSNYPCDKCGKCFPNKLYLSKHMARCFIP